MIDNRTLLGIFTLEDRPYFYRLTALSPRTVIKSANTHPKSAKDLTLLANSINARAVVTTSLQLLHSLLEATPDYRNAQGARKLSLDDYAGSILDSPPVGLHSLLRQTAASRSVRRHSTILLESVRFRRGM